MFCEQCKCLIAIVGGDEIVYYCEITGWEIKHPEIHGRFCKSKVVEDD